jgi:hypothetical protein
VTLPKWPGRRVPVPLVPAHVSVAPHGLDPGQQVTWWLRMSSSAECRSTARLLRWPTVPAACRTNSGHRSWLVQRECAFDSASSSGVKLTGRPRASKYFRPKI